MTDEKSPLEPVFELLVYAPVGAAVLAREHLPELVDRGRRRVVGQVSTAKLFGRLAVSQGRREAERFGRQAADLLAGLGITGPGSRPDGVRDGADAGATQPDRRPQAPAPPASVHTDPLLAIPGYDSLAASQVVQRLDGLAPDELEAVRVHETASRGRRTILSRIAQLQTAPPSP